PLPGFRNTAHHCSSEAFLVSPLLLLLMYTQECRRFPYGIVLDAGPSRTNLFIYQWTTTKANKTGVIRECSSCPVQGLGISNYTGSPQKVMESLQPCLTWAQQEIPAEQHSQTLLYVGATTSMRPLNLAHPILSDGLLAALKSSPFKFQGTKILSSQEKEAFNWVAVNYVLENFFKYDWRGQLVPSGKGMAGVLLVGGTSALLTAKVEEKNQAPTEEVKLQLYGQTHRVYTHHCLCHGTAQLRSRLLALLIQTHRHPFKSFLLADISGPEVFNITGSSDPTACMRLVQSLLNSSSSCSFFTHSLSGVSKPLQTRFLESQASLDTLADYCLVAAFIFHLSTNGYTFDFNQSVWTSFQKKMGDRSSGWSLGYLLSLTNTIPQDSPSFLKGIEPGVWSLLLILFVVLLTAHLTLSLRQEQTQEELS
uniref:Ectonucleoside triphosphate diphosphohydrolase 2 n=1 Tax=Amazona collaria TaxID=241587 RepID=A0A8B9FP20_9PSIT